MLENFLKKKVNTYSVLSLLGSTDTHYSNKPLLLFILECSTQHWLKKTAGAPVTLQCCVLPGDFKITPVALTVASTAVSIFQNMDSLNIAENV